MYKGLGSIFFTLNFVISDVFLKYFVKFNLTQFDLIDNGINFIDKSLKNSYINYV